MDFGFENLEPSLSYEEELLLLAQTGNFERLYHTYLVDMSSFSGAQEGHDDSRGLPQEFMTSAGHGAPCSSSSSSSSYQGHSYAGLEDERSFGRIPIADWQGEDCVDWADAVCRKRGIDPASISSWDFRNSTGATLLQFSPEHFSAFVGDRYGEVFFQELQALRRKYNGKNISKPVASAGAYGYTAPGEGLFSATSEVYQDSKDIFSYTTEDIKDLAQYFPDEDDDPLSHDLQDLELLEEFMPIKYEPQLTYEYPVPSATSPSSSLVAEAGASVGDLASTEEDVFKKIPTNTRRKVRGPRSWEFLVRLLVDKRTNPALIRWEDEATATFRLTQPNIIAQMWGKRSKNPKLSYVNFARGLRYHYNTGALEPVSERQLVYRWGPKALEYLDELRKASQ
ncbi:ETS homologous factor-like [Macrobrachium rosenbergii]|uniref:ETS homologous factor-like n=1 Tax=Macrobrachium rosenbergii TaxID=79674 RepID=UPI0034D450E2